MKVYPTLLDDERLKDIVDCLQDGQSRKEVSLRFGVSIYRVQSLARYLRLQNAVDTEKALQALKDMEMAPEEISDKLPSTRVYGGVDILEEMLEMKQKAQSLYTKALNADKIQQAISALRENQRIMDTMVKMADRMRRNQEFNPWNHPDVIQYQEGLIEILRKHPDAMEDVIGYLRRFSSGPERSIEEGESE